MLSPDERLTLFDALRPPSGFELDAALATTFSLDLDFLAATLVALSGFGEPSHRAEDGDEAGVVEAIDVIEAVRRSASRLTVLTQAGQIAVRRGRLVHAWLEDAVAPVVVRTPHRVFHPKLWFLRYRNGEDVAIRLLCGTRNLTFDTSWDTMVQLDGRVGDDDTHPELGNFLRDAVALAQAPLPASRVEVLMELAASFTAAQFELPEHATDLRFHPLGFGAATGDVIGLSHRRALVISPFLSADRLASIASAGSGHILVAREHAIAQLGAHQLAGFETYALDPDADVPGTAVASETEGELGPPDQHLTGLHAKLYLLEEASSRRTRLLIGSANATNAAFGGNVELLTELTFPRSALSIDQVLDNDDGVALRSLLRQVTPPPEPEEKSPAEQLSDELDVLRRAIAERPVVGTLEQHDDDYLMRTKVDLTGIAGPTDDTKITCWPTSLTGAASARPLAPGGLTEARHVVSFAGITRFLAVRVAATRGSATAATSFVVPVQLGGLPANRSDRLLATMLADPDRFTRYLLMLLADPDALMTGLDLLRDGPGGSDVHIDDRLPPIFEALMRAVARHPERLAEIGRLAAELERAGGGVLPDGWESIWPPIHRAAGGPA
jgi:hypothetical protein